MPVRRHLPESVHQNTVRENIKNCVRNNLHYTRCRLKRGQSKGSMRGREAEAEKKIKGEDEHVQGGWMPECLTGTYSITYFRW